MSPILKFKNTALPEQSLEIFGKLRSTSIARIHGYKKSNSWHQGNFLSLENKTLFLVFDGILNGFHLNCDYGQHFN